jgi:hypothetical protein
MTTPDRQWGFSNPGPGTVLLWLEPWAEEFEIPARSTVILDSCSESQNQPFGQVEWTADHLVVWASAQTVAVSIDGVLQHSGSAVIPIPDGLNEEMLRILFADQPAARLGGAGTPATARTSWWKRTGRCFGL